MKLLTSGSIWALIAGVAALLSSPILLNVVPADVAIWVAAAGAALAAFSKSVQEHLAATKTPPPE